VKDTLNKNWKPTQKIVKSGDWIISEWKKWLYQKRGIQDLSMIEIAIIDIIAEMSFRYGNRYCYLSYSDFGISKATVSKHIKSLQEKGLLKKEISYLEHGGSKIKGKNKYILHLPDELKDKFKFYGKKDQAKEKQEIDISEIEI